MRSGRYLLAWWQPLPEGNLFVWHRCPRLHRRWGHDRRYQLRSGAILPRRNVPGLHGRCDLPTHEPLQDRHVLVRNRIGDLHGDREQGERDAVWCGSVVRKRNQVAGGRLQQRQLRRHVRPLPEWLRRHGLRGLRRRPIELSEWLQEFDQ